MSDTSSISWTTRTWNPTVGCTKVSAGCDHCYAETLVNRFAGSNSGFPNRFDEMHIRDDRTMLKPLSRKWQTQPGMVFVNSLSDVFHRDVPDATVARIFAVMSLAPGQTFQLLTKRHGRMRSLLNSRSFVTLVDDQRADIDAGCGDFTWPLPNLWLGVSVEVHYANGDCDPDVCGSWGEQAYREHDGDVRSDVVHLVLENARPVRPVDCRGALGAWRVPDHVRRALESVSA